MPVKIIKNRPYEIKVGDEIFKCRELPEKEMNILRSSLNEINDVGEVRMEPKSFVKFCYDVAYKSIFGWENVTDEETEEDIPFLRSSIKDITQDTIFEFGQKWLSRNMGVEEIRSEEVKNSETTSPSCGTSQPSRDVDIAERPGQSTD